MQHALVSGSAQALIVPRCDTPVPRKRELIRELLEESETAIFVRTDRMFVWLLLAQLLFAVLIALWLTPRAWNGTISRTHPHVWIAIFLGAVIVSVPCLLVRMKSGWAMTRHAIGISQMLMSGLLIHLSGGRIETHFHVFGSLAFLASYRDWKVLISASVVTALDHFVRGVVWPESVFGAVAASHWRWVEHTGWVIFEDVVLIRMCIEGRRDLFNAAFREARLLMTKDVIEREVESRTHELRLNREELGRSEAQLRSICDGATDAIITTDERGVICTVNTAAVKLFQYTADEMIGQNVSMLMPEPFNAEHDGYIRDYLRTGIHKVPANGHEVLARLKDGNWCEVEIRLIDFPFGERRRLTGFVRDVREQKRLTATMYRAKNAAEKALRVRTEFMANMSHEIRTPMNGIIGLTELVLESELTADQRDLLETVRGSAETLLTIINDILDFSKIEAGKMQIECIEFLPHRIVADSIKCLKVRADSKGLRLDWNADSEVPEQLIGDPVRLRQIITNLVGNAIKFTPTGEVTVSLTVDSTEDRDCVLHIRVRDTGIGIPESKQASIFEAFSQADASTTRNYGGTGLGLSICRLLVSMMKGRIWVESREGAGSTFHVTVRLQSTEEKVPLPRGDAFQAALPSPFADSEAACEKIEDGPAEKRHRLLLVEDNPVNQKVAGRILQKTNCHVTIAGNGEEAVEAHTAEQFDIILMDVQMPVMDGLQATAAIRERELQLGGHVPIIAMTAHAMAGDRERFLQAGMDYYVSKPVRAAELLAIIQTALTPTPAKAEQRYEQIVS